MKLKSFRVRMFKSIIDSGEVTVPRLAVIVGKNESGKTSLLKALHKVNPAIPEPYSIKDEWPRGHRESRDENHVPCECVFELTDQERTDLWSIDPNAGAIQTVRVLHTYAGNISVVCDIEVTATILDMLMTMIPSFVYMDEYQVFPGMAYLDQAKARMESPAGPSPEDRALMTILGLAALDLDELIKAGKVVDKTERQHDLSDGGATITKRLASHWNKKYIVELDADQQQFWTFIKSPNDTSRIKLEERSRGFRWFFSFDAKLMHETKGELQDCVILLDEPGLHLHPGAQQDLLKRLTQYAVENTLIYTTHLPFMIDLQEPDRIRVLNETPDGPTVTENLTETSPDAKLTLQAALGMSGRFGMPVGDLNLTVEGAHDYWYLTALSDLLARSGHEHLPPDVVITACGGAPEVTYMSTFMVGQGLQVTALYDSDGEGRTARDKFIKNWLTRYKGGRADAMMLHEASGLGDDTAIEDLFEESFFLKVVLDQYQRHLPEEARGTLTLLKGGPLAKRVENALKAYGVFFNKGSVAKILCAKIRAMKTADELPPETLAHAKQLMASLNKSLASGTQP